MLLIAATRTGSISHLNPAAEASSNTLRVTCIVTKHIKNWAFGSEFAASCCCMLRNHKNTTRRMLIFWMLFSMQQLKRWITEHLFSGSVTKSVVGLFVLTHRFWSPPISGVMHGWPCLGKKFPLMWFGVWSSSGHPVSLTEARRAADVFGVILAAAVARLSCLTQGARRRSKGGGGLHE